MKVLAISGWKGSGKDTLAYYLVSKGGTRVSFADPLKDMVAEEYGVSRASLDEPLLKEKPILSLPVDPKDAYSRMIAEFLFKEFRTSGGLQAAKFVYQGDDFYGDTQTGYGICRLYWTPRALAILKGSTNRSVRSNYWVQKAIEKVKKTEGLVVISDLRYRSEMDQLKQAFGDDISFIRVERFDMSPSDDPSERDLDGANFDYRINNRGTKEQAYQQLDNFLASKQKGLETNPQA